MRIDEKILSIPPYISTQWSQIRALYVKGNLLVITLHDGDNVNIPGLSQEVMEKIFLAHSLYLEQEISSSHSASSIAQIKLTPPLNFLQSATEVDNPLRFAFGNPEGSGIAMQHNPAQANAPDLPQEVLNKVSAIAKIVTPEDLNALPKAEPHCNCVHCQIARAIHRGLKQTADEENEEKVADEELQFQQWDITQAGDKLFNVINRLDKEEQYRVFLGNSIGCTCGKEGCEHIIAVLKS